MKIDIKDINETRKDIVVTLDASDIDQEHDAIAGEFVRMAKIPGFRPGKAPRDFVLKRFEKEIQEELKQKVMSKAYRDGLKESKLEVLTLINVSDAEIALGQSVKLTFTVEINPEFELPDYKGLKLEQPSVEVKAEEVDEIVESLRKEKAEFTTVERASQDGDYLKFSLEGTIDGKAIVEIAPDKPIYGKMPQTWEEVGTSEGLIPGLAKELGGLAVGDKKDIEIEFPKNFSVEVLSEKKAVYSVEALEVRERLLPEINDEFLKAHQTESLDQLKGQILSSLKYRKESEGRSSLKQQASEKLAEMVECPIPESLIESETQSILQQVVERNLRMGVPQEEMEKNKDELHANARKSATIRAKMQLILAKIAEAEKLSASNEDMSRVIMQEAMKTGTKPEKLSKELSKDQGRVRSIQQSIVFNKALDFLVDQATVSPAEN
ncbi:MAG: trigger factor [Opitutaceae bacterium]|nr:trigger factor [Opitutaceae bacterium]